MPRRLATAQGGGHAVSPPTCSPTTRTVLRVPLGTCLQLGVKARDRSLIERLFGHGLVFVGGLSAGLPSPCPFLEGIDELGCFCFGEVCRQVFSSFLRERAQVGLLGPVIGSSAVTQSCGSFSGCGVTSSPMEGSYPPDGATNIRSAPPGTRCSAILFRRHEHEAAVDDERLPGGV